MRRLLPALGLVLVSVACNRGGGPPAVVAGPASPPGWEVRYNASVALARRGSDAVSDARVRETLLQMLDEEQQMRNFRREVKGKQVTDAGGAYLTVITALQAVSELRRRRPEMDLTPFKSAVETLVGSRNLAVSTEAKKTFAACGFAR